MTLQQKIRSKSPAEWRSTFGGFLTDARIFLQENGEKALVLGFAIGAFIVLFFKAFVVVACLVVLAVLVILVTAEGGVQEVDSSSTQSDLSTDTSGSGPTDATL